MYSDQVSNHCPYSADDLHLAVLRGGSAYVSGSSGRGTELTSYLANMNASADMVNSEIFLLPGTAREFSDKEEQMFGNTLPVNAVNRSDLSPAFLAGTFTLAERRHLTEDDYHKALIHKDYASKNGLKVGDKLTMRANQFDADNRFGSTATFFVSSLNSLDSVIKAVRGTNLDWQRY